MVALWNHQLNAKPVPPASRVAPYVGEGGFKRRRIPPRLNPLFQALPARGVLALELLGFGFQLRHTGFGFFGAGAETFPFHTERRTLHIRRHAGLKRHVADFDHGFARIAGFVQIVYGCEAGGL
jgi:hypothetical protein